MKLPSQSLLRTNLSSISLNLLSPPRTHTFSSSAPPIPQSSISHLNEFDRYLTLLRNRVTRLEKRELGKLVTKEMSRLLDQAICHERRTSYGDDSRNFEGWVRKGYLRACCGEIGEDKCKKGKEEAGWKSEDEDKKISGAKKRDGDEKKEEDKKNCEDEKKDGDENGKEADDGEAEKRNGNSDGNDPDNGSGNEDEKSSGDGAPWKEDIGNLDISAILK